MTRTSSAHLLAVPACRSVAALLTLVSVVTSCGGDSPTSMRVPDRVSLGKGGGGSGDPTVTSTDPVSASQDTTLDVTVLGSGFTTGAKATWSLGGDTTQVHVQSTKVVSSGKIVAHIQVPASAPVASYDVVVTLSDGKKGVGAELFAITYSDPTATFEFPLADAALGVKSDHLYSNGTYSLYADRVCGVEAKIFATTQLSNTGDATMQTATRKCPTYTRSLTFVYGDGVVAASTVFVNVREIKNTTYAIPPGATVTRGLHMNETRCGGLVWQGTLYDGTVTGADSVLVTRVAGDTWHVQSQPAPLDKAYCKASGILYHIPVDLVVVSNHPLP
jgi:hypothetical protein